MVGAPGREEGDEDDTPVSGRVMVCVERVSQGKKRRIWGEDTYIHIYIYFFFNNHIRKHLFEVSHEIKLKLHKHKSTLNRKPDSKGQSKNKEN